MANNTSNTVSVFRNTSSSGSITSGSFAAGQNFTIGNWPNSVAIGDLDGDGKPDLAVANYASNTVSVLRNTASIGSIDSSSFATKVDFTIGTSPGRIAIGDLDGDGKPDLAVTNFDSNTVSVFRNTATSGSIGSGSFASKVDFATGTYPLPIAIGDLDGDGKPDLAVANAGSNTVSVLRNTTTSGSIGSGSFAAKQDFATGSSPRSVAIGDLDGDGKPDLAVANINSNKVSVLRNTSTSGSINSGSFAAKQDFATGFDPHSVAIGDLDGDGKPDLAVANYGSNKVSVFRNTSISGSIGSGSFASKQDFATGSYPNSVAIGDLDGDGKPDLVVTNNYSSTVSVLRNADPTISTTGTLIAFSSCAGSAGAPQSFSVSGTSLTANITVTAPTGFEVSTTLGSGYGSSVTLTQSGGTVPSTTVYVRLASTASGTPGGNITCASTGVITQNVAVSGIVNTAITSNTATAAQTICAGSTPAGLTGSTPSGGNGSSYTYSWLSSTISSISGFVAASGTANTQSYTPGPLTTNTWYRRVVTSGVCASDTSAAVAITVNALPTISLGTVNNADTLATSFNLPYTATTGSPNQYSITTGSPTAMPGFSAVTNASLPLSPINVTIPASAVNTYNFVAIVRNSTTGCVSGNNAFTLTVVNPLSISVIGTLSTFTTCSGTASTPQSFSVSGTSIVADITVTAPTGFEVSTTLGSGYGSSIILTQSGGTVPNTTIYVRLASTASGTPGGNITCASAGAITQNVAVSGTVNTAITSNTVTASQTICAGLTPAGLTGSTPSGGNGSSYTYSWLSSTISSTSGFVAASGTANTQNYTPGSLTTDTWYRRVVTSGACASDTSAAVAIVVNPLPTISLGTVSNIDTLATSFSLPYTATTGSPNQYSITTSSPTAMPGFSAVTNASLPASPINVTIPASAVNTYNFVATVRNSTTGCVSSAVPFTLTITATPTITSFSPLSAKPGDAVTITGINFNTTPGNNIVFFGATRATVTAATATSITATVPTGATYAPITVLNTGISLAAYSRANFNPIYNPAKTSIGSSDFNPKQDFTTGTYPISIAIGDLDGDGKPDLAVANHYSNTVSVFRNTAIGGSIGSGSFAVKQDFATGTRPISVAIGDLDGDGKPDLAVANGSSNTVSVFRNTATSGSIGSGSFASKVDFTTGIDPYSVAIGDLDGDGKPDLAVANVSSNTVSVLRNTATSGSIGSGSFAAKVDFTTGSGPLSVAIGDLDGDGKPDLAVTNYISNTVSVLRNTATGGSINSGSFASKQDFTTGTIPRSLAIGDLDGDEKPDLVLANQSSNTVSVLRNTATSGNIGSGSFATKQDFTTGNGPRSVAIGDLDGDGKPDLAVANDGGLNTVSVLRNTATSGSIGSGSFAVKQDFTANNPYSLAIGDIDGDGRPDLVLANATSNTVSVLRNAGVYNNAVSVDYNQSKVSIHSSVQPNPFINQLSIEVYAPKSSEMNMEVTDMMGRMLMSKQVKMQEGDNHMQMEEMMNWMDGVYFITLKGDGYSQTHRVVKLK